MTDAPSTTPNMAERVSDAVTDAQQIASQTSGQAQELGRKFRAALDEMSGRNNVRATVEDATRSYPLLALGIAFLLGAAITRRRYR